MDTYVGIDLGTTNSAIASYVDGKVRIHKSPEQYDVTPSVIYANRRQRFVGSNAYNRAAANPENAARLFKRFMGTDTAMSLADSGETLTPVDASAEILRTLVGYLSDDMRSNPSTGTVITIPAAFNQMQRDATSAAAEAAGIPNVALMQEPVAAVMAVMQEDASDGIFLIYDLGGGTLDVAIAESIRGQVSLLAHGGVNMLGGRDFDRRLFDNIVRPWLFKEFHLPVDAYKVKDYAKLFRMAEWAAEKAKIELSQREQTTIGLAEDEIQVSDLNGEEIFLDIALTRSQLDQLIREPIRESVDAARAAIKDAGLTPHDIQRVVFVGGPTQYAPLREEVSFQLGIKSATDVNPMTAVAQGAAIFAESIDWSNQSRGRKQTRGTVEAGSDMVFRFDARTPSESARVGVIQQGASQPGLQIQFDSETTGWTSGRVPLVEGHTYSLPLPFLGDHRFRVAVFKQDGSRVSLPNHVIVIARTAATIEAIPASHTISIEALDKAGGSSKLIHMVRKGDHLPKSDVLVFQAQEAVVAGSTDSLNFKLWEGEIEDPITDNRPIGSLLIKGTDLYRGQIPLGAELRCTYQVLDSGNIRLEVEVPAIGETFREGNFYVRQTSEEDFADGDVVQRLRLEKQSLEERIERLESTVVDDRLAQAKRKTDRTKLTEISSGDPETVKQLNEDLQEAKALLGSVTKDHHSEILRSDLDEIVRGFEEDVLPLAEPREATQFENLKLAAYAAIEQGSPDQERYLEELYGLRFGILWRQGWFVEGWFRHLVSQPWLFDDQEEFRSLEAQGETARMRGDDSRLRAIVWELNNLRTNVQHGEDVASMANIIFRHRG